MRDFRGLFGTSTVAADSTVWVDGDASMPRNRFRSQPTLQRTGSRSRVWPWALGAAAIAVGALIGAQLGRFTPTPSPVEPRTLSSPASVPPVAMADAPAVVPVSPAPQAPPTTAAAKAPVLQVAKLPPPRRKPSPPTTEQAATPSPAPQAPTYEERREAFQLALARYDKTERAAGYQWAKENRVARSRFCRDESRTPAFMAGCLDFLHKAPPNMGDAAQDAAGHEPD